MGLLSWLLGSTEEYAAPRPVTTKWFDDFEATLPDLNGKVVAITGCTTGTGGGCGDMQHFS